jgi:hypothetical protein
MSELLQKDAEIEKIAKAIIDELACKSELYDKPPVSICKMAELIKNYKHLKISALSINSIYGGLMMKEGLDKLVFAIRDDLKYMKKKGNLSENLQAILSETKSELISSGSSDNQE